MNKKVFLFLLVPLFLSVNLYSFFLYHKVYAVENDLKSLETSANKNVLLENSEAAAEKTSDVFLKEKLLSFEDMLKESGVSEFSMDSFNSEETERLYSFNASKNAFERLFVLLNFRFQIFFIREFFFTRIDNRSCSLKIKIKDGKCRVSPSSRMNFLVKVFPENNQEKSHCPEKKDRTDNSAEKMLAEPYAGKTHVKEAPERQFVFLGAINTEESFIYVKSLEQGKIIKVKKEDFDFEKGALR